MKLKVSIMHLDLNFTYASDGPTHYLMKIMGFLKTWNLKFLATSDSHSAKKHFKVLSIKNPFIRLEKGKHKTLKKYSNSSLNYISSSNNVLVISNGYTS